MDYRINIEPTQTSNQNPIYSLKFILTYMNPGYPKLEINYLRKTPVQS